MLVAIFALIGLVLACISWETSFHARDPDGTTPDNNDYLTLLIVMVVSVMGAVAIIFKYYFEAVW